MPHSTAKELIEEYGPEGEHSAYGLADWRRDVHAGTTRLGYWEWVSVQIEHDAIFMQHLRSVQLDNRKP